MRLQYPLVEREEQAEVDSNLLRAVEDRLVLLGLLRRNEIGALDAFLVEEHLVDGPPDTVLLRLLAVLLVVLVVPRQDVEVHGGVRLPVQPPLELLEVQVLRLRVVVVGRSPARRD